MIKKLFVFLLPWPAKRKALNKWFGYQIEPGARIGLAWVYPAKLIMKKGAVIDHFTVAVHLDKIELQENATIGRSNWITGFASGTDSLHFQHQTNRVSALIVGRESAITKHHHIDCTSTITIGSFVTVAGYYSQLLTHSIDIYEGRQDSKPILIGDYSFIGTNSVILGGATLPAYSVLGAKSMLNKAYEEEYQLYAGNPAKPVKALSTTARYFTGKKVLFINIPPVPPPRSGSCPTNQLHDSLQNCSWSSHDLTILVRGDTNRGDGRVMRTPNGVAETRTRAAKN